MSHAARGGRIALPQRSEDLELQVACGVQSFKSHLVLPRLRLPSRSSRDVTMLRLPSVWFFEPSAVVRKEPAEP